jgi:hypothetical protein
MSVLLELEPRPSVLEPPLHRWPSRGDSAVAVGALATAALMIAGDQGPLLAAFKLAVWLAVPGWVCMRRVPAADPAARVVWIVLASVVLTTILGFGMIWTGLWYPRPVAVASLVAAAGLVLVVPRGIPAVDARTRSGPAPHRAGPLRLERLIGLLPWFILGAALLMWGAALAGTDPGPLGDLGLLAAYPVTWFLALGLVLALCVWGIVRWQAGTRWIMSASVASLVVVLYASASLLAGVPRLPWVYKHIAVTNFISATGHIDPSIDIYNRWPGFFVTSAFVGDAIGYKDATAYASWAELGFALADVLIVLAIARTVSGNPRVYWSAATVFALTNWVGQNYYAPQGFAFTLYLAMCLAAFSFLRGTPGKAVRTIERWSTRRPARPRDNLARPSSRALRTAATVAILLLQVIITASHQLTPYMAVLGLLPLFAFGFFRPRWVGPVLLAIAVAYLIPNLDYVARTFGLFTGFDPLANASAPLSPAGPVSAAAGWQETGVRALSGLTILLASMGFLRHFRSGELRSTLLVVWLAVAPALTLVGQSYGGEGRLRVYLFALPWLAIGVGWLFWSGPSPTRKAVVGATISMVAMALLFTATYFQSESKYRVSKGDVMAAQWLDSRMHKGDSTVLATGAFPLLVGPNYPLYLQPEKLKSLEGLLAYFQDSVQGGDVEYYISEAASASKTYVIFSRSQEQYATQTGLVHGDVLPGIEKELAADGSLTKIFDNGAARIYEFTNAGR